MPRIRLQVVMALVAIVLLVIVMGYLAITLTTVTLPDAGGTYVEGVAGNPDKINPILCQTNPVDQDLAALIFSGLTRADESGEIVPDLAERWEISPDGTVYTFYLRQDVLWHDGASFGADDVVFTVNAMQDPGFQGVSFLSDIWRTVVVKRVDAYTVSFSLRAPFAPFLDYTTIGVLPLHILGSVSAESLPLAKFNAAPVGTGPFQIGEVSARRLALVVNPEFYRARPYLDRVEFVFYPNTAAVFDARQRDEIMGISRLLPENLDAVRDDESLQLFTAPVSGYNLVYLNLDKAVFQDPAVRQAMLWALDRQALVDQVLGGQGVVIHSPILPNSWAYDPNVLKYRRDLQKARVLLEGAGWFDDNGDGVRERGSLKLEFTLATNEGDAVRAELIAVISAQLAEVGIRAVPETVTWDELVGERLRLRRYDAVLGGWQNLPPDPDPYPYWHSSQANENGINYSNYISEEADLLLQQARVITDHDQRAELYRRFQATFANDVPALLLYQPVYNYAVDESVYNVQIGPLVDSGDRFRTLPLWYVATRRMLYSEARDEGLVEGR